MGHGFEHAAPGTEHTTRSVRFPRPQRGRRGNAGHHRLLPFIISSSLLGKPVPTSKRYTLDPLLHHREDIVDGKVRALAARMREAQAASEKRCIAEEATRAHEEATRSMAMAECSLVDGGCSAADLMNLQHWQLGQVARANVLRQQADEARKQERADLARQNEARSHLAAARADVDVVARDKERFVARREREALVRQDDEAEDAHAARALANRRMSR